MKNLQNLHTHNTYCDGKDTPEEMISGCLTCVSETATTFMDIKSTFILYKPFVIHLIEKKGALCMKYLIITKKHIMLCLSLVLALVAVAVGSTSIFANNERKLPIYCVETEKKQIAISFDAAWGNDDTQQLIDILAEYEVPATFFVVGAWVDKYPESVKALCDAGHRIENHSNTHPYMSKLSKAQICDEIESCNAKIEAVTGRKPTLIRPPYGDYNNTLIETVASLNMYTIQWSVETLATKVIV